MSAPAPITGGFGNEDRERMVRVETVLSRLGEDLKSVESRLSGDLKSIESRIVALEKMDVKLREVEEQRDALRKALADLGQRVSGIEKKNEFNRGKSYMITVLISIAVPAVITAFIKYVL